MAIEYHLEVKEAPGESASTKHKGQIELLSWSWGASNPTTIVGEGMSAGKVSMSDLSFTKRVDKSSPKLLTLCVTGDHAKDATLVLQQADRPEDSRRLPDHQVDGSLRVELSMRRLVRRRNGDGIHFGLLRYHRL